MAAGKQRRSLFAAALFPLTSGIRGERCYCQLTELSYIRLSWFFLMILHVKHIPAKQTPVAASVVSALVTAAGEGQVQPGILENLNVHLDWVQYKTNFREAISLRRAVRGDEVLPGIEVGVDLRQVRQESLKEEFANALNDSADPIGATRKRVYLEAFTPVRSGVIWRFNDLFWQHLPMWESAAGHGFEDALPGRTSDANHPEAIADAVADFWTLLKDLDGHKQLPPEIFTLEIGVGTGQRAAAWLDRFRALDRERGTQYYPRLRFLLADYSMPTLNRAMEAVREHRELASFLAVDALDPFKSLSFLRYKVLSIHLTNVYDNLPTDEIVVREGKLYFVEARAYVPAAAASRISEAFGIPPTEFTRTVNRLLEVGPQHVHPTSVEQGVMFWRSVWDAIRLEERFVAIRSILDAPLPAGVKPGCLKTLLARPSPISVSI